MRGLSTCLLVASTLLALAPPNHAQVETAEQRGAIEVLEATLDAAMEASPSPGLAVALVNERGAVWSRGYGYADLARQRPVTTDTPFLLASVSKTFIAAAMMTEVEAGRLELEQPVNDVLSFQVKNPWRVGPEIRVWHLASHTSSIRDNYRFLDPSYAPGDPTIAMDAWIESYLVPGGKRYRKRKSFLPAVPGTRHEYSNIGAALGAVVVEQTSGMPYRALLRQRIIEPLGMTSTAFDIGVFPPDTIAIPYERAQDGFRARAHYGFPTYADGQLRSSVDDMARYVAMMINRGALGDTRILRAGSIERIETEWVPTANGEGQALYWRLLFDGALVGHDGGDWGASTFVYYQPTAGTGAVILMNSSWSGSSELMVTCLQATTDALKPFRRSSADAGDSTTTGGRGTGD